MATAENASIRPIIARFVQRLGNGVSKSRFIKARIGGRLDYVVADNREGAEVLVASR